MDISWACCIVLLYLAPFLKPFPILVTALPGNYWIADSSSSVTNSISTPHSVKFDDGSFVRIILANDLEGYYACHCGFFCNPTCDGFLFSIFSLYYVDGNISKSEAPRLVWIANPENPVSVNASLKLTSERGLVLKDADGSSVWSTNISSKSVASLYSTKTCNLMLLDDHNATIIWQSFDHPTDTLVLGQKLVAGQQLISQGGLYSLSLNSEGLFSYINSNLPQRYYSTDPFWKGEDHVNFSYGIFMNRGMTLVSRTEGLYSLNITFYVPLGIFLQYMRFEPDGHLRAYDSDWNEESDLLREFNGVCDFPMACGKYGICTNDQCSCPPPTNGTNYFRQTNNKLPNNGYSLVTPLPCEDSKYHVLSELENTTYFPMDIPQK